MLGLNRSAPVGLDPELSRLVHRRHRRIGMSRTFLLAAMIAATFAIGSPVAGQEPPTLPPGPFPPTPCDATCVRQPVLVCEYVETVTVIVVHANGDVTVHSYDRYECELQ